ncbi:MAG: SDR family oxidoreductase [Prosthecobacter sp.]|jgi:NAD(P)-dependent dehydrogenase (short-subunit alcohol dehydrogenase family)|uniref:SDR family oxidoreductase n=1 Tax=Prosthecobacter sp. TaxID=1965333 RepID=UPI0019DDE706|nr:SDR family oxidoreductase [Prosthecobacter sp.]MBE2282818.1 SDR family oxidoreductase [Prosthecobacter sp.]
MKTVVITGCTRGLGRAMVPLFAEAGWRIAGCGRNGAHVAEVGRQFTKPHFFSVCDVSRENDVAGFCAAILEQFGPPDLVLNNAAIINANAPLWETSAEDFSRIVDINIKGPAAMMRHLLPAMLKRGGGVIVNFSSGWGRCTAADVAPYCATKYAIEGLSMATAQDTGGRVAVIPMNPGIIDTDMLRSTFGGGAGGFPDADDWARRAVPFFMKLGPKDNGRPMTVPGG